MIYLNKEFLKKITTIDMNLSKSTYRYDPNQYFLISLDYKNSLIHVQYINPKQHLNKIFKGTTARQLSYQIFLQFPYDLNIDNIHAAYIGRELMKAEICLILKQKYIQS